MTIIATGGLAPLVINEVSVIDAHEPWLTLIGLRLVFERNTSPEIGVPAIRPGPGSLNAGERQPAPWPMTDEPAELPEQMRVRLAKREPAAGRGHATPTRSASRAPRRSPRSAPGTRSWRRTRRPATRSAWPGGSMLSRIGGKLCFATIRDGTGDIQVMISLDRVGEDALAAWKRDVDLGDHDRRAG